MPQIVANGSTGDSTVGLMLVTVIIPTFNRCDVLRRCLEALTEQAGDFSLEVIIADDGSTDGTETMVDLFASTAPFPVRYFRQQNAGPSAARNRALRMASGAIAYIINDDTIVGPGCISTHVATHRKYPASNIAVLGRVTLSPEVPRTLFSDLHLDATFQLFAGLNELDWRGFITCNLSLKPAFLLEHGMFEERMFPHEDLELGRRLAPHGLRILYRESALAYHHHHLTERDYLRVAAQDGRALARWYRIEPTAVELLTSLGLQGRAPLRQQRKHQLAGLVISGVSPRVCVMFTRLVTRLHRESGVSLYRRLYQYERRRSIEREMTHGPANPTTAF
ncbi:MAG: glycosyltransferase family 2 protein [Gemmatimonas sp.]